jgi:hypothetical protein
VYLEILGALALCVASALFLTFAVGLLFDSIRRASRLPHRRRAGRILSSAGACLCAAVFAFTFFYRPSLEFAAETAQIEYVDEEDDGEPETPAKSFNRQLKRIRRGEKVESLVVRL